MYYLLKLNSGLNDEMFLIKLIQKNYHHIEGEIIFVHIQNKWRHIKEYKNIFKARYFNRCAYKIIGRYKEYADALLKNPELMLK